MSTLESTIDLPSKAGMTPGKEETRRNVLDAIQGLHGNAGGLSRIHRTHPALYAQARRAFGSWRAAGVAAGLDYGQELHESLRRGLMLRDQRRALWHALSRFLIDHPGADDTLLATTRPELARRVERCWGGVAGALAWAEQNRGRSKSGNGGPEPAHAASES